VAARLDFTVDEDARRRFEAAWAQGKPLRLECCLPPPEHPAYLPTLEELVHIDLEMAWKRFPALAGSDLPRPAPLESILERFPVLGTAEVLARLIRQEFRVRQRHGDKPTLAEYVRRFPQVPLTGESADTTGLFETQVLGNVASGCGAPVLAGYDTLQVLGRGGMGVVYQARQQSLNRLVAIKMILARGHAGEAELRRFQNEATAVARLNHPNIVQIHEVGEHDGLPYLVLEFCAGGALSRALDGAPLPPERTITLVAKLARACQAAHERNIVHRDLKPANVLLNEAGEPKIADFGLAKATDDTDQTGQTESGAILGTPSYMAPEQAAGKSRGVGPAADIYSLGAILYELMTGRPPFKGVTPIDTVHLVLEQDPVAPSQLQPRTPRDLETICLKCLRKEPGKRYASALELAEDLERLQRGEPILARPTGRAERTWRWCRRNPAIAALLALVLVTLAGGSTVATIFALEAQLEAKKAKDSARDAAASAVLADKERKRARQEEAEAKRSLYVANVNLAGQALEEGEVTQARALLKAVIPKGEDVDLRGFEWHYFWRRCHLPCVDLGKIGQVHALALTPDGRTLAVAEGLKRQVNLWTVPERKPAASLRGFQATVNALAISADGRLLASAEGGFNQPGEVKIWDLATRKIVVAFGKGEPPFMSLAFSPDGKTLLTGTAELVHSTGSPQDRYSPVKRGNRSGAVKLWDTATGMELATFPGPTGQVFAVAFAPTGKLVAAGNSDGLVSAWNVASQEYAGWFRVHFAVRAIAFAPANEAFAVAGGDWNQPGQIRLFPVTDKSISQNGEGSALPGHRAGVTALAFAADGKKLFSGSYDRTIRAWEPASRQELGVFLGHFSPTWALALSPDGQSLFSGSGWSVNSGEVKVWPIARILHFTPTPEHYGGVYYRKEDRHGDLQTRVLPDRKTLALVDARTGEQVRVLQGEIKKPKANATPYLPRALAFSPSGKRIAAGDFDGMAALWNADTGERLFDLATGSISFLEFSPDNRTLASCGDDRVVRLWDVDTGQKRLELRGHSDIVWSLAFSPDGRRLATHSWDGTVRIWDPERGIALATLKKQTTRNLLVRFLNKGKTLVSAGEHTGIWEGRSPAEENMAQTELTPGESGEGYTLAAHAYLSLGRFAEAEKAYRKAESWLKGGDPSRKEFFVPSPYSQSLFRGLTVFRHFMPARSSIFSQSPEVTSADVQAASSPYTFEKTFPIRLEAGKCYEAYIHTLGFDAILRLADPAGKVVAEDKGENAYCLPRIFFNPPTSEEYRLIATSVDPAQGKSFQLVVRQLEPRKRN